MALKGMDSIELEENIYPIDAIDQELAGNLTIDKLFDVYRFVDMRTHLVHDYNDGKMCEPAANVMSCGIAVSPVRIVHPKGLSSRKSKS